MKKTISFILALCLVTGLLTVPVMAAQSKNVEDLLNDVLEEFPAGSYFTTDGQKGSTAELTKIMAARGLDTSGFDVSYTCVGFAKFVWARLFGHSITSQYRVEYSSGRAGVSGTWSEAAAGDLVYFYRNSDCQLHSRAENGYVKDAYVHAAIVWDVSETGVTLYDCNFKGKNQIGLYTVRFGESGWPKSYCRLYHAKEYKKADETVASGYIHSSDIVKVANDLVGKYSYVWGGKSPAEGGFDCTGLVYYIYHTCLGYAMTLDQARGKQALLDMGEKITSKDELLPGDIIQYTTSHVGIYTGGGNVVHSGTTYGVSVISINSNAFTFAYGIRLPNVIQAGPSGGSSSSAPVTSTSYEDGSWIVTVPSNYKLDCYSSATSSSPNGIYVRAQSEPYRIACTQHATLPGGTEMYYAAFNGGKNYYWFKLTSAMTVTGSAKTPDASADSGITFNSLTTPGNLSKGRGGHVGGSITSTGSPITSVIAEVINVSTGQVVLTARSSGFSVYTYGPIKGSKIDTDLKFGTLPVGTYYIKYTATTSSGATDSATTAQFSIY